MEKEKIKYRYIEMWEWWCPCGMINHECDDPKDTGKLCCDTCDKTFTEFDKNEEVD